MRAKDFLIEYRVDVMVRQFGAALNRVYEEQGSKFDWLENQYLYLYSTWEEANNAAGKPEFDDMKIVERLQVQALLDLLDTCDPTNENGSIYMPWIVSRIASGKVKLEDVGKIKDGLSKFHILKTQGWFKRNPGQRQLSDIGRFPDVHTLFEFLDTIGDGDLMSNSAKDKAEENRLIESGEAIVVADTPTFKIVIPKTKQAAMHFGRNTRWCTAAKINNAFAGYTKDGDDLYIILDKKNNRRWQFFFGQECQFMDERDNDISGYYSEDDWGSMGEWLDLPAGSLDPQYWETPIRNMTNADDIRNLNVFCPAEWSEIMEDMMKTHNLSDY